MRTNSYLAGDTSKYLSRKNMAGEELIICGWDELFILDLDHTRANIHTKIWSWRAKGRPDLPETFRGLFDSIDECKPFDHGSKILITSSGGAVALIDRNQDEVLFYAKAANAHSADLLPNGRVAVATSDAPEGRGDRLIIFDLHNPDRELLSYDLPSGHGVVWDENRQQLWGLSNNDIRVYKLQDWDSPAPKLLKVSSVPLPDDGGHDLYPVGKTPFLSATTNNHCWYFNRDTHEFASHPALEKLAGVKSICQHPITHQLAYVQAEGENWWAENIHFADPDGKLHMAGEFLYKARWNIRVQ
jgi:Family of unknown function (DUF6528)